MMTEEDLINLGYKKKQDSFRNKGADFRYGEPGDRDYLVHLSNDGTVTVTNSAKSKKKDINNEASLDVFEAWHNSYEEK